MISLQDILLELTLRYMFGATPSEYKSRANDISVKLITRTKNNKYFYKAKNKKNGHEYNLWIKPLKKGKLTTTNDAIVWCSCGNFTYENEYFLWNSNASHIINSNGKKPVVKNPKRLKKMCKHLVAAFKDLNSKIDR